jgi:hypothetical protein
MRRCNLTISEAVRLQSLPLTALAIEVLCPVVSLHNKENDSCLTGLAPQEMKGASCGSEPSIVRARSGMKGEPTSIFTIALEFVAPKPLLSPSG